MTATGARDASTLLNGLIEICKDGEEGFRTAATGIHDSTLRRLLESYAHQRAGFAQELQAEVARAYREAVDRDIAGDAGTVVERQYLQVKDAHDHVRMLERTEAGESRS